MHPMIIEAIGTERSRELQEQAAAGRRALDLRRSRRALVRIRRARRSLRIPATA